MKRSSEEVGTGSKIWFACSLGVLAFGWAAAVATAAERPIQLPTEAEILRLRSTCAAWGQQILEGNSIRSAIYQEQVSRYSPWTNRCYVEMRVYTNDLNKNLERFGQYLYDGQTREMLAFAQIQNGKKPAGCSTCSIARPHSKMPDGMTQANTYSPQ